MEPVIKSAGLTKSEVLLAKLAEMTFIDLWSFPNVFRDQTPGRGNRSGKELCDLLVVFGDDVLIFSDKSIGFDNCRPISVAWQRWYRSAVLDAARQVNGAARWISEQPSRVYLDPACSQRFPFPLPTGKNGRLHLIVVARGAGKACAEYFSTRRGSLWLNPWLPCSPNSVDPLFATCPFTVGNLRLSQGFVHVFNEYSLESILGELDTVSDFVVYLTAKEEFLSRRLISYSEGEESLLAAYLQNGKGGGTEFAAPHGYRTWADVPAIFKLAASNWDEFIQNTKYLRMKHEDRKSFIWDHLIRDFTKNMLEGTTLTWGNKVRLSAIEEGVRIMAAEPRLKRRLLGMAVREAIEIASPTLRHARLVPPTFEEPKGICYIFLQLPYLVGTYKGYDDYREYRRTLLAVYSDLARLDFPQASCVVGIAMEPVKHSREGHSKDLVVVRESITSADRIEALEKLRRELGIMDMGNMKRTTSTVDEYPN